MSEEKQQKLILSIETATRAGSLALLRGNEICAEWVGGGATSHSNELLSEIDHLLRAAQVEIGEVDLLAAATGPGSFTSLRVGLATLKGLRAALGQAVCGVETLAAVAFGNLLFDSKNILVFPAGRAEVFVQQWENANQKDVTALSPLRTKRWPEYLAEFLSENSLEQSINWIVAPEKQSDILEFIKLGQIERWQVSHFPTNLAVSIGRIASERFASGEIKSVARELSVVYGREVEIGRKAV